eukprot:TRINITY_DN48925_c0_g1_i1.p1 TRINITY_DN48925_c0_g1~~TRINITY_DN48925_c0_g1_i1.p1  ORF type:complete len:391 (-),score=25.79 TRINITY_DN48925_c0_g1_i1:96-1184(-)
MGSCTPRHPGRATRGAFSPHALASFAIWRLADDVRCGKVSRWSDPSAILSLSPAGLADELDSLRRDVVEALEQGIRRVPISSPSWQSRLASFVAYHRARNASAGRQERGFSTAGAAARSPARVPSEHAEDDQLRRAFHGLADALATAVDDANVRAVTSSPALAKEAPGDAKACSPPLKPKRSPKSKPIRFTKDIFTTLAESRTHSSTPSRQQRLCCASAKDHRSTLKIGADERICSHCGDVFTESDLLVHLEELRLDISSPAVRTNTSACRGKYSTMTSRKTPLRTNRCARDITHGPAAICSKSCGRPSRRLANARALDGELHPSSVCRESSWTKHELSLVRKLPSYSSSSTSSRSSSPASQ